MKFHYHNNIRFSYAYILLIIFHQYFNLRKEVTQSMDFQVVGESHGLLKSLQTLGLFTPV